MTDDMMPPEVLGSAELVGDGTATQFEVTKTKQPGEGKKQIRKEQLRVLYTSPGFIFGVIIERTHRRRSLRLHLFSFRLLEKFSHTNPIYRI